MPNASLRFASSVPSSVTGGGMPPARLVSMRIDVADVGSFAADGGLRPADRSDANAVRTSNQKGAPSITSSAVSAHPKSVPYCDHDQSHGRVQSVHSPFEVASQPT